VDPVWEYLVFPEAAQAHLRLQATLYGFVGHSHLPLVYREGHEREGAMPGHGKFIPLDGMRLVANPGSVGQPRDGDPRAAYAIVDTQAGHIAFRRVEYDVAAAQRKIRDAGLPEVLAARLSAGR
jgi:diadenosine tetraphosphatase ApaH/serine/threonine PP2A family protein phosphatase